MSRPAPDGRVLPFPPTPSASVAGATLKESRHARRDEPSRLRADAPNVLVILLDDIGFGLPDTFGGEVHTPTLTRLRDTGIGYNAFHTTAICSPTRAALRRPRSPAEVVVTLDGQAVARTTVAQTVPGAFSATETFDIGEDLGSPVSLAYHDRRPFRFSGRIDSVTVTVAT